MSFGPLEVVSENDENEEEKNLDKDETSENCNSP